MNLIILIIRMCYSIYNKTIIFLALNPATEDERGLHYSRHTFICLIYKVM